DVTLMDGITDGEHPMDKLDMLLSADEVFDMLERLDETDRKIVVRVFGLDGREPETYMKISKELGICRERTRQRCQRALNKMHVMATQNPMMSR
ncbi:MAG: sigma factor-like helix-turn-helix DNA-binding protein, partial [Opitutae bacterium]